MLVLIFAQMAVEQPLGSPNDLLGSNPPTLALPAASSLSLFFGFRWGITPKHSCPLCAGVILKVMSPFP